MKQIRIEAPPAVRGYRKPTSGSGFDLFRDIKRQLERLKLDSLTDEERNTKIINATIGHFSKLFERFSTWEARIEGFLHDVDYENIVESKNVYENNLLQFCMRDFFEKNGYYAVQEISSEYSDFKGPQKSRVKCSQTEEFDVYTDATIFYYNPDKDARLVISLTYDPHGHHTNYLIAYDEKSTHIWKDWNDFAKENNFYKGKKIDAVCNFLEIDKNISWDDIILPDAIRENIRKNIENTFSYGDIFKKNEITLKRGVILAGSPGTGKTLICKILAKTLNVSVIYVLPSHIHCIPDISRVCDMAQELAPSLLIMEDIDWLATNRNIAGPNAMTVELMNKLDGIENFEGVVTLATTNMPEKVEEAIKNRPGRFDRVIQVNGPDEVCIKKMLIRFTRNFILDKNIDLNKLTKSCKDIGKDMSGAYIKNLCDTAAACAVDDGSIDKKSKIIILRKHFREAMKEIKDKDFSQLVPNAPLGFTKDVEEDF